MSAVLEGLRGEGSAAPERLCVGLWHQKTFWNTGSEYIMLNERIREK
jgi:hypothetical protein